MNEGDHEPARDDATWEQYYVDGDLPWDTGKPDLHLAGVLNAHAIEPAAALEIGCGTGTNSIWLANQGFAVTGLDLAPTAIELATQKAAATGASCQFIASNFLTEQVPGGPFHFVYDRGCFHTFDDVEIRARFSSRVAELLAPEGVWLSLIGSTDGPPRDAGPPRRSAAQIVDALEPCFEILELRSSSFDDGEHSHARAWVVVARRRAQL